MLKSNFKGNKRDNKRKIKEEESSWQDKSNVEKKLKLEED